MQTGVPSWVPKGLHITLPKVLPPVDMLVSWSQDFMSGSCKGWPRFVPQQRLSTGWGLTDHPQPLQESPCLDARPCAHVNDQSQESAKRAEQVSGDPKPSTLDPKAR